MVERYTPQTADAQGSLPPRVTSKYARWHDSIVSRAKGRKREDAVYLERHHIVPKCMGGTERKENLVLLTPEEHFVVHQLLVKLYPGNKSIVHAAVMLTVPGKGQERRGGNKRYGWLKRKFSVAMAGNRHTVGARWDLSPEARANIGAAWTEERREAQRKRLLGNKQGLGNRSNKGKKLGPRDPSVGQKIRARMLGNQNTKGMKFTRTPSQTATNRAAQIRCADKARLAKGQVGAGWSQWV